VEKAFLMASSETWRGATVIEVGEGMLARPDVVGCFSERILKFSSVGFAGQSAELIMRTAALMLPSSILAVIEEAKAAEVSFCFRGACPLEVTGSCTPMVLFLMIVARLCRFPPLTGLDRMFEPKWSSLDHGSG
jgi:hypothetical protein